MPMTLLSSVNRSKSTRRLLTWKEAMEKKGQSKCRKDEDYGLRYGPLPPAEFR